MSTATKINHGIEPITITVNGPFTVPCPYCEEFGTHKGTCTLSMMNTGKIFAIQAVPIEPLGA